MTAFKEYDRLEATGLWRATPEDQRREVIVSVGEATLTISDMNDRALAHWSLAALARANPGESPAIYSPDGDPGETLELSDDETTMIAAIERLHHAIERARPRPGRLRFVGVIATLVIIVGLMVFWLPGAMLNHTVSVVPDIRRQDIGRALLARIERVSGPACANPQATGPLAALARRTGARRLVVLRDGVRDSLHLPGGIVLVNHALIENHEDPAVVAGYILTERARAARRDPLARLLADAGPLASFRLLTTGQLTDEVMDRYSERILTRPRPALPDEAALGAFATAGIPTTPYAWARDSSGETTLALIEGDPTTGKNPAPVMADRDWILLQNICGE